MQAFVGPEKATKSMATSDHGTLERLAATRNFRVVSRGSLYWIVSLTTGFPEPNGNSLIFTFEEALAMLRALTPTNSRH